jgi:hypothetical protein
MKSLWQWGKHDVVKYLRVNFLETNVEFTTESLIKKINKSKSKYYDFGYDDKIISKHISDLVTDGYLEVRYVSVKMEPNNNYNTVTNSDNCKHRFGSKTLSVYKMVDRNKKIENILK